MNVVGAWHTQLPAQGKPGVVSSYKGNAIVDCAGTILADDFCIASQPLIKGTPRVQLRDIVSKFKRLPPTNTRTPLLNAHALICYQDLGKTGQPLGFFAVADMLARSHKAPKMSHIKEMGPRASIRCACYDHVDPTTIANYLAHVTR